MVPIYNLGAGPRAVILLLQLSTDRIRRSRRPPAATAERGFGGQAEKERARPVA